MKRETLLKTTDNRKVYRKLQCDPDPYWDEGLMFYPRRNRGTHHCDPQLLAYQVRMYKTWKHNRRHQWKSPLKTKMN